MYKVFFTLIWAFFLGYPLAEKTLWCHGLDDEDAGNMPESREGSTRKIHTSPKIQSVQNSLDGHFRPVIMKTGLLPTARMERPVINPDEVQHLAHEKSRNIMTHIQTSIDDSIRPLLPEGIILVIPARIINEIRLDPAEAKETQAIKMARLGFLIQGSDIPGLSENARHECISRCFAAAAILSSNIEDDFQKGQRIMTDLQVLDMLTSTSQLYLWAGVHTIPLKQKVFYLSRSMEMFARTASFLDNFQDPIRDIYGKKITKGIETIQIHKNNIQDRIKQIMEQYLEKVSR